VEAHTFLEERSSVYTDPRDEPSAQRFVGVHSSSGQCKLANQRVVPCGDLQAIEPSSRLMQGALRHQRTYDLWKALQSTDVGSHADVHLRENEECIFRTPANVARRDKLDARTDAWSMDRGDDALAAGGNATERVLPLCPHVPDVQCILRR
jgi:hypothetical protein